MKMITESSGNIFKDLGFENYEELKVKAELARQIEVSMELQGIKQKDAENSALSSAPKVLDQKSTPESKISTVPG